MVVADLSEEPMEDTLGFLMCGEWVIFSQNSLMDSQLVYVDNTSTPMDPVGSPPKDPETEQALEPSPSFSWYMEVVEENALFEQLCTEAREERLQADQCLPFPAGSVQVLDDLVEEVEQ